MMDVLVRNVDDMAVKKLDQEARKRGLSREEFLRIQLQHITLFNGMKNEYERYELALNKVTEALNYIHFHTANLEKKTEEVLKAVTMLAKE
ncbi:ribbon-helix-helix protein, CopG family [Virgibacillus sp. Bac330]|uniref:ribbon-helix-helix protein, CopG family n=1 Tax=Virgibacillus sp. Bac330 TaxID=2419841 RepID=UPI000EF4D649|nr:ribbon-helix-helix protein, CopG family [Virgibacillus sp. Bac330]